MEMFQAYRFCQDDQEIVHDDSEVSTWIGTVLTPEILDRLAFHSNRQALEQFLKFS